MSGVEDIKEQERVDGRVPEESEKPTLSSQEEEVLKKKYGGIVPKKPPLISKDHERAYFDSADWALGKQGVEKPKGPLEALRPKLQPTQQQTRSGNLLMLRQTVKMEQVLRLRMELPMYE